MCPSATGVAHSGCDFKVHPCHVTTEVPSFLKLNNTPWHVVLAGRPSVGIVGIPPVVYISQSPQVVVSVPRAKSTLTHAPVAMLSRQGLG